MHDAKGKPLKVGDKVLVPGIITQLSTQTEEYCNVSVTSHYGRRPDSARETISAINTGVLLRANPEDGDEAVDLVVPLKVEEPAESVEDKAEPQTDSAA